MFKTLFFTSLMTAFGMGAVWADSEQEKLHTNLEKLVTSSDQIGAIAESPMEGVYEVVIGQQPSYIYSHEGYLLIGDVYDTDRRVNLREEKSQIAMVTQLNEVSEDEMIIMGDVESERYVTVFTDITCGYCRKFHQGMNEMATLGLKVRYMMYPRAGVNSQSFKDAVSVWCADEQGDAMTVAKTGGKVPDKTCENPVASQYNLGQRVGVRGTPTIITDNGKIIPGYVPPQQLLAEMEI